jgi:hypothetical protein
MSRTPDGQAPRSAWQDATPDAQARAEAQADNPALMTETVAKAEQRAGQGWPWPVSGDATTLSDPEGTWSWPDGPRHRRKRQ